MKLYSIRLSQFRILLIESGDDAESIRQQLISKGWSYCTVQEVNPGTIHDIPDYKDRNKDAD